MQYSPRSRVVLSRPGLRGVDKMIEMCYNSKTVVSEVYLIGSKNE